MPRSVAYSVLDVFAERPLEGNPLAVFHDARGLSDFEMQALARETNLAETTFVLPDDPATEAEHGVCVRIFTTQEELPFAGHPTLGTATWLHEQYGPARGAESITLRLPVGPVPVRFTRSLDSHAGVFATMQQPQPQFGAAFEPVEIAAVLGLEAHDVSPDYKPQIVSTGIPFCVVLLRSIAAAGRLAIPQREASAWLAERGGKFFYCLAPAATCDETQGPHWHNRMQFYGGEDPATGSAAGCAIAWLVRHRLAPSGQPVVFEQGVEIRRPSRITVEATQKEEGICNVRVAGRTIPVASGKYFLP